MRSEVRPVTFALGELLLGLFANARSHFGLDLESFWILVCATDATMRPVMLSPDLQESDLTADHTRDEQRGRVSRRFIADETGLPRETVRRKTRELVEAGLLAADEDGLLFVATRLSDRETQRAILDGHALILRYLRRLEEFGLDPKQLDPKQPDMKQGN